MVVIEPAPTEGEENNNNNNSVNVTPISKPESSASPPITMESEVETAAAAGGSTSDGFETASDSEVNDRDDGGDNPNQSVSPIDDNCRDAAAEEEELKQKALKQANDAKLEGNKLFASGNYDMALLKYDLALQVAPDMPSSVELRSICHGNRGICFLKLGKNDDAIKECTKALELNPNYVKALLRRAEAHEKLEHFEEAVADMKKILELDASNMQARGAIVRLEPLAMEKREKMKEEMIGKLKEMGNSLLGKFGMSVDNFKSVQDPKTGAYSISFQR